MTIAAWVFARSLNMPDLRDDVRDLLNRHSRENASNTPDFILADFLMSCLEAFEFGVQERESWYGIKTGPKVGDDAKAESPAGNAVPAGYFDGPPNPPLGQPAALDEEIAHEQLMTAAWKQRAEAAEKTLAEVANMCEDHEARYAQIGYLKDRPRRDRQGHGREGGGVSTQDDGGPAFPVKVRSSAQAVALGRAPEFIEYDGMSLRDYFAAKAMQALIIAKTPSLEPGARGWPIFAEIDAYLIADAMLAARKS